jgi:hypothetical protein
MRKALDGVHAQHAQSVLDSHYRHCFTCLSCVRHATIAAILAAGPQIEAASFGADYWSRMGCSVEVRADGTQSQLRNAVGPRVVRRDAGSALPSTRPCWINA